MGPTWSSPEDILVSWAERELAIAQTLFTPARVAAACSDPSVAAAETALWQWQHVTALLAAVARRLQHLLQRAVLTRAPTARQPSPYQHPTFCKVRQSPLPCVRWRVLHPSRKPRGPTKGGHQGRDPSPFFPRGVRLRRSSRTSRTRRCWR